MQRGFTNYQHKLQPLKNDRFIEPMIGVSPNISKFPSTILFIKLVVTVVVALVIGEKQRSPKLWKKGSDLCSRGLMHFEHIITTQLIFLMGFFDMDFINISLFHIFR